MFSQEPDFEGDRVVIREEETVEEKKAPAKKAKAAPKAAAAATKAAPTHPSWKDMIKVHLHRRWQPISVA